ncbi:ABC transporter permease [Xylanimonas allomyrinae]|nr:ABC transporter permease [Xylanimonas allomyrinae]
MTSSHERTASPGSASTGQHSAAFGTRDPKVEVVSASRLSRVGARPSLGRYLMELWRRRHFLWAEARAKVGAGSRETRLGQLWLVMTPMLDGLVFYVMFGLVLRAGRGVPNFIGFLLIGVFLFGFASRCITAGSNAINSGKNLIKAFQFPRASLPIAVVLREVLNLGIVLAALGVLLLAFPPAEIWSWRVALVVPILGLLIAFVTGVALFFARICAAVPDVNRLISLGMRLFMWGSGVMFPLARFENQPALLAVIRANPLFIAIDMARSVILHGLMPGGAQWLAMSGWAVGALVLGLIFFWKAEESYGRA